MPGGRPPTRASFLAYQQSIRPNDSGEQFMREWGQKNARARSRWADAYNRVAVYQRDTVAPLEIERFNAETQIGNISNAVNPDAYAYIRACDTLIGVFQRLEPLYRELARRWEALHQLEQTQRGTTQAGLSHALNSAHTATGRADRTAQNVQDALRDRNTPPVPRDANGRQRMPAKWFKGPGKEKELLRHRSSQPGADEDAENGNLRMGHSGTWVAVKQFEGGQSTGWLWVEINPRDGRVIDVSSRLVMPYDEKLT